MSFRTLRALLVAAFLAAPLAVTVPVQAEEKIPLRDRALHWLMEEDVSILDWGVFRLDQDMKDTARWIKDPARVIEVPRSGVFFEWRRRQILAWISLSLPEQRRTSAECQRIFQLLAKRLTEGGPTGSGAASWYLSSIFTHAAFGNYGRPRPFGDALLQLVTFEVTLQASPGDIVLGDDRRARCSGPLNANPEQMPVSLTGANTN